MKLDLRSRDMIALRKFFLARGWQQEAVGCGDWEYFRLRAPKTYRYRRLFIVYFNLRGHPDDNREGFSTPANNMDLVKQFLRERNKGAKPCQP